MSVDLYTLLAGCPVVTPFISYLRFYQDKVNKEHDEVIFDIFVGEVLAARALRQTHAFSQRAIVGAAISAVQMRDGIGAFDADGHRVMHT